jgi:hypothetical protein
MLSSRALPPPNGRCSRDPRSQLRRAPRIGVPGVPRSLGGRIRGAQRGQCCHARSVRCNPAGHDGDEHVSRRVGYHAPSLPPVSLIWPSGRLVNGRSAVRSRSPAPGSASLAERPSGRHEYRCSRECGQPPESRPSKVALTAAPIATRPASGSTRVQCSWSARSGRTHLSATARRPGTTDPDRLAGPAAVVGVPSAGKPIIAPENLSASTTGLLGTEPSGDGVIGDGNDGCDRETYRPLPRCP